MGGLIHLVQRWGAWAEPQPAQAPPRCTQYTYQRPVYKITVLLYNGPLLRCFNVPIKGLKSRRLSGNEAHIPEAAKTVPRSHLKWPIRRFPATTLPALSICRPGIPYAWNACNKIIKDIQKLSIIFIRSTLTNHKYYDTVSFYRATRMHCACYCWIAKKQMLAITILRPRSVPSLIGRL